MNTQNADGAQDTAQVYDVGRICARRFAGVRIGAIFSLRTFMAVALMLSLYAQLGHTAHVANYLSKGHDGQSEFNSYVFAIAVEFSVLLLVLAGHKRLSWLFAVATFLTNLAYFWIVWAGEWQSANAVFAVLMSLLLPAVIVAYSHSVVAHKDAGAHVDDTQDAQDGTQAHTDADAGGAGAQVAAHTDRAYSAQDGAGERMTAHDGADGSAGVQGDAHVDADADAGAHKVAQVRTQTARKAHDAGAGMTRRQRLMHIKESGTLDAAQVAAQYGIKLRQAQIDIKEVREAMTQTNGHVVTA